MPFVLPVRGGSARPDNPPSSAETWELAAPGVDGPHLGPHEGTVSVDRTGPGDVTLLSDQWMNPDIFVVGRQGVMNGRQLFDTIPDPPPEGHGEYGFAQNGPKIDHSTRSLALFWSDWNASTAKQAGGACAFTGEHVTIVRTAPGSTQGYQPTGMEQPNNARSIPAPWDAALTLGQMA